MTDAALKIDDEAVSAWNHPSVVTFGESLCGTDASRPDDATSDAISVHEISELVSGALQTAMLAAAQPCPATYVDVLEGGKHSDILSRMKDLPAVQQCNPVLQAEVLKEFAMIREQSKLANDIVDGIRNYTRSKRRAAMAAMT